MRLGSHRKSTSIYNSAGAFSQYINFPEAGKVVLTIVDRARKAPVQSLGALDDSEWVRSYCIVAVYNFHGQWQYFQRREGGGGRRGRMAPWANSCLALAPSHTIHSPPPSLSHCSRDVGRIFPQQWQLIKKPLFREASLPADAKQRPEHQNNNSRQILPFFVGKWEQSHTEMIWQLSESYFCRITKLTFNWDSNQLWSQINGLIAQTWHTVDRPTPLFAKIEVLKKTKQDTLLSVTWSGSGL